MRLEHTAAHPDASFHGGRRKADWHARCIQSLRAARRSEPRGGNLGEGDCPKMSFVEGSLSRRRFGALGVAAVATALTARRGIVGTARAADAAGPIKVGVR